jgi:hypothetical protein
MAVCCQNLTLGALSSRSVLSMLGGALFLKKFGLFLNTAHVSTRTRCRVSADGQFTGDNLECFTYHVILLIEMM